MGDFHGPQTQVIEGIYAIKVSMSCSVVPSSIIYQADVRTDLWVGTDQMVESHDYIWLLDGPSNLRRWLGTVHTTIYLFFRYLFFSSRLEHTFPDFILKSILD